MRRFWGRTAFIAVALSLAACGDSVKFPGIDDASEETTPDPATEPDPTTDPAPDASSDPAPDPVTDPVTEPDPVPDTETDPEPEPEPEPDPPADPTFEYYAPGDLIPGSGQGSLSETIFAPDMIFPVATDPTIPQSQVFRPGGGTGPCW